MKLHLGCGHKILKDFINIDIRTDLGADIIDDITKLDSIKNDSINLIYACHVLEHFGRNEYLSVLKRWYTVLSVGGTLRLSVPDFENIVNMYNSDYPLKNLMGFLYGGQTYEYNYHYLAFDFKTLKDDLESIGFKDVKLWDWRETEHAYMDDFSQSYIPHIDKDNGVLMSLNIEAIK
jgi:predicted SAM-dependent methyltransferase